MGGRILCFLLILFSATAKTVAQPAFEKKAPPVSFRPSLAVLPQNFYNRHLGFLCKKESQLRKRTGLPLAIRLGSKATVDYLEQKPGAPGYGSALRSSQYGAY